MARITGRIIDKESGAAVEARVQVLSSGGGFLHPPEALLKVGPGMPFFYCDGQFSVDAPRGLTQITVERGTEYVPAVVAALRATLADPFQHNHLASLGGPWPFYIVSGPVVNDLGLNADQYVLGPGSRPNSSISANATALPATVWR